MAVALWSTVIGAAGVIGCAFVSYKLFSILYLKMECQPTPTITKQSGVQPGFATQYVQWGFDINGEYVQKETTASEAVSVDGMKARWRGILGLDGDL